MSFLGHAISLKKMCAMMFFSLIFMKQIGCHYHLKVTLVNASSVTTLHIIGMRNKCSKEMASITDYIIPGGPVKESTSLYFFLKGIIIF